MSNQYKIKPSEVLNIKNNYESFCFDEACLYIIDKIKNGEEPNFKNNKILKTDGNKSVNENTIEWMMKHSKPI